MLLTGESRVPQTWPVPYRGHVVPIPTLGFERRVLIHEAADLWSLGDLLDDRKPRRIDRGTLFGLKTGDNTAAIVLPSAPEVIWR
jgi:hypothetical protein